MSRCGGKQSSLAGMIMLLHHDTTVHRMDFNGRSSSASHPTLVKSPSLQTHLTSATSSQRLRGSAAASCQATHSTQSPDLQLGTNKQAASPVELILNSQGTSPSKNLNPSQRVSYLLWAGYLYVLGSCLFLTWQLCLPSPPVSHLDSPKNIGQY